MAERCQLRESLGAYVLGHLDAIDAAAVEAHVAACPACAAALRDLVPTAAVLATVDPAAVPGDDPTPREPVPADLVERVVARVGAQRARRLRLRVRAVAAVAAVVTVLAVAAVAVPRLGDEPEEPLEQVVLANPTGPQGTATLRPWDWGTGIHLEATGLEPGDVYGVWFADASGDRLSAGTFVAVDDGEIDCYLTSAMLRPEAAVLGVTDIGDGTDVLAAPLR
jgi:anti-sigma factor RsiW